jgi:predicted small secreted protein
LADCYKIDSIIIETGGIDMQTSKSTNYEKLYSTTNSALSKASQSASASSAKAQISSYIIGQILKGQVIDLQQNNIKIMLSNGQLLSGSLEDSVALSILDQADFVVTENQNNKLVLKLLSNGLANTTDATIDKALEEANLVKTERNVNVVNELLKQSMSIDKNTIQTILRQASQFKNASIETLVLMNKYGITLTDSNTTQFEAYRNYEHRLLTQAQTLSTSLLNEISTNTSDVTNQLHQEVLKLVLPETNQTLPNNTQGQQLNQLSVTPEAQPSVTNSTSLLEGSQLVNNIANELPSLTQETNLSFQALTSGLDSEQLKTLEQSLMNEFKESFPQDEPPTLEQLLKLPAEKLLTSPEYKSALEHLLIKNFTLSTDQLLENNGISHYYEKVEEKLEQIKQMFTQLETASSEGKYHATTTMVEHLKDNVDFMKVLNQFFGYVQLPMKLPNQYSNSELFVYTNKKQLQEGNKNVSVLLHLNMEHLGPIDFHLSLLGQQVTAKISLAKEDSLPLIEQNLPQLQQALETKGYSFLYEVQQIEEETNVVNSYFNEASSDMVMKRYTFDKRA